MKKVLNITGCVIVVLAYFLGATLPVSTSNLSGKIALAFSLFLFGIYLLIKGKK